MLRNLSARLPCSLEKISRHEISNVPKVRKTLSSNGYVACWFSTSSETRSGNQPKKLFTPGPLCVSKTVKEAMLQDLGSRDTQFIETVKYIRSKLLDVAGVTASTFTTVPLQGCGTYAVEAVLQTVTPRLNGQASIVFFMYLTKRV
ncbi:Uncharacterised protein g7092 [Pycnogonum litorale]